MRTISDVERIIIKGGSVKLEPKETLADAIGLEEETAAEVVHNENLKEILIEGYNGTLYLPARSEIKIEIQGAYVSGSISSGTVKTRDLELEVKSPAKPAERVTVTRFTQTWSALKDIVGIVGATAIFWMVFNVMSPLLQLEPSHYLVWQIVLGAGAYYGFSGRWVIPGVAAIIAVMASLLQEPDKTSYVFAKALIKLAVFLAIMGAGKWTRDYVDRYRREGYAGLKNKLRR